MRKTQPFLAALVLLCLPALALPKPSQIVTTPDLLHVDAYVVILGSSKGFFAAQRHAKAIARRSHVPYTTLGRVYDSKRGLIYSDRFHDEMFAGRYVGRRDWSLGPDSDLKRYVSDERSEFYDLKAGRYVVVGAVKYRLSEARQELARYKKAVLSAYIKKTKLYIGCRH